MCADVLISFPYVQRYDLATRDEATCSSVLHLNRRKAIKCLSWQYFNLSPKQGLTFSVPLNKPLGVFVGPLMRFLLINIPSHTSTILVPFVTQTTKE